MDELNCCGICCDGELNNAFILDGELERGMEADGECGVYQRVSSYSADYNTLRNKPLINGVELQGNKTAEDLMLIGEISNSEILSIWNTVMNGG